MEQYVCTNCSAVGKPEIRTVGSTVTEILLWLCLLIPGVLYSIWRREFRHDVCPFCGTSNMVRLFSR